MNATPNNGNKLNFILVRWLEVSIVFKSIEMKNLIFIDYKSVITQLMIFRELRGKNNCFWGYAILIMYINKVLLLF